MAQAPVKASGSSNTDYITVTADMVYNAQAQLSGTPVQPTRVLVDIVGGISQGYQNDFMISGSMILWSQMGLQTLLEVGDVLRIQYFTN